MRTIRNNFNSITLRSYSVCRHIIIIIGLRAQRSWLCKDISRWIYNEYISCVMLYRLFDEWLKRILGQREGEGTGIGSDRWGPRGRHEGVNSRKRRGEFNSHELARDEIAARRLVANDLGHNYLNARGWINCCISHAKLILIRGPSGFVVREPVISPSDKIPLRFHETGRRSVNYSFLYH